MVCTNERIRTVPTNIVIDDKLMNDAHRATGLKTKPEAVELGLRTLPRLRRQEEIRRFRGKLNWQGGLGIGCLERSDRYGAIDGH